MQQLIDGLQHGDALALDRREAEPLATSMVVLATYWLSYEYVRDPRHALEPESAAIALNRGAFMAT